MWGNTNTSPDGPGDSFPSFLYLCKKLIQQASEQWKSELPRNRGSHHKQLEVPCYSRTERFRQICATTWGEIPHLEPCPRPIPKQLWRACAASWVSVCGPPPASLATCGLGHRSACKCFSPKTPKPAVEQLRLVASSCVSRPTWPSCKTPGSLFPEAFSLVTHILWQKSLNDKEAEFKKFLNFLLSLPFKLTTKQEFNWCSSVIFKSVKPWLSWKCKMNRCKSYYSIR